MWRVFGLWLVEFIFRHEKTKTFTQTSTFQSILGFRDSGIPEMRKLIERHAPDCTAQFRPERRIKNNQNGVMF